MGFVRLGIICILFISCENKSGRWSREWEEKFEEWQPSEYIMDAFGIEEGEEIGEVGAGNGRFAVKVAKRIGSAGRVYANDIDPKALRFMRRRIKKEGLNNMEVVKGSVTNPGFAQGSLDLVYLVNTYDDLDEPVPLLRNIAATLKPNGRLAIMVYDTDKVGSASGHAVSKDKVINQAVLAGFELVSLDSSLRMDTIFIFKLNSDNADAAKPGGFKYQFCLVSFFVYSPVGEKVTQYL